MGSSGSGSFSDYSDYKENRSSNGSTGQNNKGGFSGDDKCTRAFSTNLDEVSSCEYFKFKKDIPTIGTQVRITFETRLLVIDDQDTCIGYLPTKYNYLRACMADDFSYSGVVISSSLKPIPSIIIDIAPV